MDVLSASSCDNTIAWYENDGNQNFTTHIITTAAIGARSVYVADVDGDGDLDVLSASSNGIAWYENDGSQNFTSHTVTTDPSFSAYAADVNSDGDMDMLSATYGISWYEIGCLYPPRAETICEGDTLDFYGIPLSTAGVYSYSISHGVGCDSIIEL